MKKNHGFSLVETMIALGVMSVIVLGLTTFMSNQGKSQNYTQLSIEATGYGTSLATQIPNTICSQNASSGATPNIAPAPAGFDPTPLNAGQPVIIPVNKLNGYLAGPPVTYPTVAQGGTAVPTMTNGLTVQSMQIVISKAPTIQNTYVGDFQILMNVQNPSNVLGPPVLKASFPIILFTNGQTNPVLVNSCHLGPDSGGPSGSSGVAGFCTPPQTWDNVVTVNCPAISNFTSLFLTGIGKSGSSHYRTSGCCYIPNSAGSGGWCSGGYQGWNGTFSTNGAPASCGPGTANYTAIHINGVQAGASDEHFCCFAPTTQSQSNIAFGMPTPVNGANSFTGCGNPTASVWQTVQTMSYTPNAYRYFNCAYFPR